MVDIVPVSTASEVQRLQNESSKLVSKLNEPGSAAQLTQSRNLATQGISASTKAVKSLDDTTGQLDDITQQYLAARQLEAEAQQKLEPLNTKAQAAAIEKKSANLEAHRPLADANLKSIADIQATRKVIEARRNVLSNELNGLDPNGKKLPGIVRFFNSIFREDIEAAHNQALASQLAVEQTIAAKIGNTSNLLALELSANQMQSKKELEIEQKSLQTQEAIRVAGIDVSRTKDSVEMLGKLHGWKKETAAAFLEQARTNIGLYSADLNSVAVLTAQTEANLARDRYNDRNEYAKQVRKVAATLKGANRMTDAGVTQYINDTWEFNGITQFVAMHGAQGATFAHQIGFGVNHMADVEQSGLSFAKLSAAAESRPFDPTAQRATAEAKSILQFPEVQTAVGTGVAVKLLGPGKTWADVQAEVTAGRLDRETVLKAQREQEAVQLEIYTDPSKIGSTLWTAMMNANAAGTPTLNISQSNIDEAKFSDPKDAALVKSAIPNSLLKGPTSQDDFDKGMLELVDNLNTLSTQSADRIKFLKEVQEKLPAVISKKTDLFGSEYFPTATKRKPGTVTPIVKLNVGSAKTTVNPATPLGFQRLMQLRQLHQRSRTVSSVLPFMQDTVIGTMSGQTPQQIVTP